MKLGVFTVVFGQLPLTEALDRVVALGLDAVEIGTGNYPGGSHFVGGLRDEVEARGLEISALSCHGNPLHPDGLLAFFRALRAQGFSGQDIAQMSQVNPARVLGLR